MVGLLALALVVSPPHFGAAPGWHVGSRPDRGCGDCVPPRGMLAHLPPGGIVIQLLVGRERPSHARIGKWPPRIRARDVIGGFEGEPDRYGVCRKHPTRQQLARADAELQTAR